MATDVFGRPLNEQPSFKVNRTPIAPNPLDPGPQQTPVDVGGRIDFSPPGESGAFAQGQMESEALGARQEIRHSQAQSRNVPQPAWDGNLASKGQLMPQKSVHTDEPRYS